MNAQLKSKKFITILVNWFFKNKRDYPWRKTKDPFCILVAELMLQRTRVDQVVPVYKKFLKKYPTPQKLGQARVKKIEREIRSLGLKKRAQVFKRIGKELVQKHDGHVPKNRDKLLELYGVGNYVANAILCHAYGQSIPTVDANYARVIKRVFSIQAKAPFQKDKSIWLFAEKLASFSGKLGSEVNLAIIDLGGNICVPRNPRCATCPSRGICDYYLQLVKVND